MTELERPTGVISSIVEKFLTGQLAIIVIIVALSLGVISVLVTPREEEPQIVVPLADVIVQFPGASAEEVERLVATPLERILWQIDGVEYVYSTSRPDMAVVTVRFYVNEDRERSLIKLHNRIAMHQDLAPPGVTGWVVKPVEIDDVPIVTLSLYSDRYGDAELRRMGEELLARLESLSNISRTEIVGGRPREIRIEPDPERMAGMGVSLLEISNALRATDASLTAGRIDQLNHSIKVTSGPFLQSVRDVETLVVGVHNGRPVYLTDVATVVDGPAEAETYTRLGFGPAAEQTLGRTPEQRSRSYPCVTLAVGKQKGRNAVWVSESVIERARELQREVLPDGVEIVVTRDYGQSANGKVNDLLQSLLFAMLTVVGLIVFTMGWREAAVVAMSVPISFSLALFVNLIFGYTINRVTLFALILSLGLVVDDPITNVDNIQRHIRMGRRSALLATLAAVKEVIPPVIMSTLAIIAAFSPMFFITGMMGPYMAPMAINVPLTVIFSTFCALTVVPWMAHRLLRKRHGDAGETDVTPQWVRRTYRSALAPFLDSGLKSWGLVGVIGLALIGAALLAVYRQVPLKMLPFDNKNELQLVIDMDEGTTLEQTDRCVQAFEAFLRTVPEIRDFESYVGTASPMDFNGLVRHYYFRRGPNLADIRLNFVHRTQRKQQSHEIVLRLRKDLQAIAEQCGANLKIVETPPGPPVISTVTVETYGTPGMRYEELLDAAATVRERMAKEPKVVDIDDTSEAPHRKIDFVLDKEKASLHGVSTAQVVQTLRCAVEGQAPATVHLTGERHPLRVRIHLPRSVRSITDNLGQVHLKGAQGHLVPLAELGTFGEVQEDQPIYHKNLRRVVYVMAEMAGRAPAEAILDMQAHFRKHPLPTGIHLDWAGEGEWQITLRVFRDLGLAFSAALLAIYVLVVIETGSFVMPLVIMTAIPLTAIGIMPGFWLLNLIVNRPIGGYENPVFFTATAMIGMIALGGIVVRNSIVLIEFIKDAVIEGQHMREAILQSGAVRSRPIMLTAATTALGAWPITLDPIFSGLAWSLIFGLVASTLFSLVVVPVIYNLVYGKHPERIMPVEIE